MASGHVNRIKRPNTWLHRPMLQNVKKALANPEPSTHGTKLPIRNVRSHEKLYSITSLARPSSGSEKLIPNALAAFRLMTNSTFTAW